MTSVQESHADAASKENGDSAPAVEDDDQGNDKGEPELEIQNTEDLEALVEDEDEKDKPRRRSWDRTRGRERKSSRDRDRDRERDRERDRGKRRSKSGDRNRRSRSNDRNKRDQSRRDPSKSNKDIERDKERAKKDNDSKALAEKEKAIKTLLDSNNVVPPGTEEEAIQIIADKSLKEKDQKNEESRDSKRRSRDRKRSPIHSRLGPRVRSPRRRSRSPRYSPRRRSPSLDKRKRSPAFEFFSRKRSNDRDPSTERREASRRRLRDRRERERSRSRDRHRSRSIDRGRRSRSYERRRSRSFDRRRRSRSYDRHSPRRRRSVSRSRSPTRVRRRSPFINELARQFSGDAHRPGVDGPLGPMGGPPGGPYMPGPGGPPGGPLDPRMMPGGGPPPGLMPMSNAPGIPPGPIDVHPMHSGGAPMMHPGGPGGPPFGGYEPLNMGFDPLNRAPPPPDYGTGPVLYNQSGLPMGPISPKPVPAPGVPMFPGGMMQPIGSGPILGPKYSPNLRDSPERIRTPEPPIISDFKPSEKTSLSSLLEASVSQSTSKDTSSSMPTFKGFKPEVIRQCERALRSLPTEDPRLNMKGRFFFDPNKKLVTKDHKDTPSSNSVLLRKGRTEIHWEEEFNQMAQVSEGKVQERKRVITLQKICQTEEMVTQSIAVQTEESTKVDFSIQVDPEDLIPAEDRRVMNTSGSGGGSAGVGNYIDERRNNLDERRNFDERSSGSGRPFEDRHDWNMREPFDHGNNKQPIRDNQDLRWSLSNNLNRSNQWNRPGGGFSPPRPIMTDHMHGNTGMDFRNMDVMRDRPGMDNMGRMMDLRDRMTDRGMLDFREREMEMEMREREMKEREMRERAMDIRGMDMPRDREFIPDMPKGREFIPDMPRDREFIPDMPRDREFIPDMPRDREFMPDMPRDRDFMPDIRGDGGRPLMGGRGGSVNDFNRREPVDDFDMRNRFKDGFNRGPMDLDRPEQVLRGRDSPPPAAVDEGDDLEIIEERVFERDSWQRGGVGAAALNNARGGAAMRNANQLPGKRPPFRGGRIGPFRNFK